MLELIITRGYPGSGKSTWAKEWIAADPANRMRSNRDDLRASLFGAEGVLPYHQEELISTIQKSMVTAALTAGKSVVVDDMNLRLKYAREWANLAKEMNVAFVVRDFDTSIDECVLRDTLRDRHVGVEAIRGIAKRFPMPWPEVIADNSQKATSFDIEPYVEQDGLQFALLVDIDGTVALNKSGRSFYDWMKVGDDVPHEHVVRLVKDLMQTKWYNAVIFMSGRDEMCRDITLDWLKTHVGFSSRDRLFMRAHNDNRPDNIVKYELFNEHVRGKYNIGYVIDDRMQVKKLWYSMGLPLLGIGDPEASF